MQVASPPSWTSLTCMSTLRQQAWTKADSCSPFSEDPAEILATSVFTVSGKSLRSSSSGGATRWFGVRISACVPIARYRG